MQEHWNLLSYTEHAFTRAQARGIKPYQVDYAVAHGTHCPQPDGTVKCVLKPANVPYADRWSHAALVGLTVVLAISPHGERRVITLYFGDKRM
ncbi:MAG: DUF4258 domain-containing protein [Caldilineaceae bacterium]|jgi:hypothetical protein